MPMYPRRLWYTLAAAVVAVLLFYAAYHPAAHVQFGSQGEAWVWVDTPTILQGASWAENDFSGWVRVPDSGAIWLQNSLGAEVTLTIDGTVVYQGNESSKIALDGAESVAFQLHYKAPENPPARGILTLAQATFWGGKQPIPAWNYTQEASSTGSAILRVLALVALGCAAVLAVSSLRLSRRQWMLLGAIFALSLVPRLVILAEKFANDDTIWTMETIWDNYVLMGRGWLAGRIHVGGSIYQQGAFIYQGLLQMVMGPALKNLYVFNTVLGSFGPVFLTLAGWGFVNRRTGIIAGVIAALYAPLIHFQQNAQIAASTTLLVYVLLAASAALYRWPHPVLAVACGVAVGVATIFRSTILFLLALPLLVLVLSPLARRKQLTYGVVTIVAAAICIAPVTISNLLIGVPVPTSDLMDYQLFRSNSLDSIAMNHFFVQSEHLATERREDWPDALVRDVRRDPLRVVELTIRRITLFWESAEHSDSNMMDYRITGLDVSPTLKAMSASGQSNFRLLMILAVFGIGMGLGNKPTRRSTLLLTAAMLAYMASLAFFYVIARVRIQMTGIVILLAAIGLGMLPQLIHQSARKKGAALALFAGSILLALACNAITDYLPRPNFIHDTPSNMVEVHGVYGGELELLGYGYYDSNFVPDGYLTFELYWKAVQEPSKDYVVSVRFFNNETGVIDSIQNGMLGTLNQPGARSSTWSAGQMYYERYLLELPDGDVSTSYDLYVGLYDQDDERVLPIEDANAEVRDNHLRVTAVGLSTDPSSQQPDDALLVWDQSLALQTIDCSVHAGSLDLDLEWFTLKHTARSAHMFVHVLVDGELVAQQDDLPDGQHPTDSWPPDSLIHTTWTIPDVSASSVTIRLGLYDLFSSERWPITSATMPVTDNLVEMACPAES